MGGWMCLGWLVDWLDGWLDGWMNEWMDGLVGLVD